jgi:hypothetical protein
MVPDPPRPTSAADAHLFEPLDRDPVAVDKACKAAVLRWPLRAIGRRPQDWMTHDLLLYRLLRDPRPWRHHAAMRNPADWILQRVAQLPGAGTAACPRVRGIQLTVLHYLHLVQLYLVRDWILFDQSNCDPPYLLRRWKRLWDCPPCGADYEPRRGARPCGMVQLCPWCRARLGVRLWQRLQAGLTSGQPGPEMVLLRQCVTSEFIPLLEVLPGYVATSADCDRANRGHTDLDEDDPRDYTLVAPPPGECEPLVPDDIYARLTSPQMEAARSTLSAQLYEWAAELGLSDGCVILTVEPTVHRTDQGVLSRQHLWWGYLLAACPAADAEEILTDPLRGHTLYPTEYRCDETSALDVGSLRRLLRDTLGWPSVCLWDSWQWWHYHAQIWSRPLYLPFGGWRQLLAEPVKSDPFARLPARRLALLRGNHRRQKAADVRLNDILAVVRPLWTQIQAEARPSRRGRPAHRQRLRELLAEHNINLSAWQLRRVLAALTQTTPGGRS